MSRRILKETIHPLVKGLKSWHWTFVLLLVLGSACSPKPQVVNISPELPDSVRIENPVLVGPEELGDQSNFMVGGIQMNEGDQNKWINNLKYTGMNTVEVTVYAFQGRWNENNLWYYGANEGLKEEIRLAKAAGLKVVLILRLQLDHAFEDNKFYWHGMVFPETEYFLWRWFEQYNRFCRMWARIAEEEGVDVLVLGSEMNALFSTRITEEIPQLEEYYLNENKQKRYREGIREFADSLKNGHLYVEGGGTYTDIDKYLEDQLEQNLIWANTIAFTDSTDALLQANIRRTIINDYWERMFWGIRDLYKGKLTIAANFDNYRQVKFWKDLDFIGINAYFPLRTYRDSTGHLQTFEESWEGVLDEILEFRKKNGLAEKPVLFTELGYGSHEGSTIRPWQGHGFSVLEDQKKDSLIIWKHQKTDYSERNKAVTALYNVVKEKEFPLGGILYWKFTSHEYQLASDPFALHIGPTSKDSLPSILVKFKTLEADIKKEKENRKLKRP